MIKGLHIRGHREFRRLGFAFYLMEMRGDKLFEARTDSIDMVERGMFEEDNVDTTFNLSNEAVQLLMDDLWESGVRPSDGTGNTGQLKATHDHLEDMRKIVFHKLKIQETK